MEIEELCKKLKPIIGDEADSLWYMYLAEDERLSFVKLDHSATADGFFVHGSA